MSDPACRSFHELLGVYVVGAIEPNERSMLDAHLSQCYGCREEFADLAVLPAMLHRIPLAEAEQLAQAGPSDIDREGPAPQVLAGLLTEVRARRRTKRLRTVLAAAAAIVVAASGGVAVTSALNQHQHQHQAATLEVVAAHHGGMSGEVKYGKSVQWGTQIWTRVRGIPQGTYCEFWITTADGQTERVSGWLVGPGGRWYLSTADVLASSITSFALTSGDTVLLRFPAT